MYEEEDDTLPNQYRRLTAHLQTSNAEFDKRLAAYLTNHVAMRAALGQTLGTQSTAFAQSVPFAGQNPFINNFPMSNMGTYANPPPVAQPQPLINDRDQISDRFNYANMQRTDLSSRRSSLLNKRLASKEPTPALSPSKTPSTASTPGSDAGTQQVKPVELPVPFWTPGNMQFPTQIPFATELPIESQQLLGNVFDPNDPLTSMLLSNQSYKSGVPSTLADQGTNGFYQTLLPEIKTGFQMDNSGFGDVKSAITTDGNFDNNFNAGLQFDSDFVYPYSAVDFGSDQNVFDMQNTNFDKDWQSFFGSNIWDEPSSQTAAA